MFYYRAKTDVYYVKRPLIKGELLTQRERDKNYPFVPQDAFEVVNIPKSRTFINFGVRLEITEDIYNAFYRKIGVE